MYVVVLACVALIASAELFHWGLHTYGYGLTSVVALVVLTAVALACSGRWW